jgi:rhamnose transport system ATP-binding protein
MRTKNNLLELNDITKMFPGTLALSDVSFNLLPGEVHALVGENGAGKSTLIKIITGFYQPDRGTIFLNGEKVTFHNTLDSINQKIAAIYQEASLFPDLTVAENIFVGHEKTGRFLKAINWSDVYRRSSEIFKELEAHINPRSIVRSLGIADKQLVEIAKALSMDSKILIMDEPTSSLTLEEVKDLFKIIRKLKNSGTGIIFISHRIDEVFEIADRATILRDGKKVGTEDTANFNKSTLIKMMVGRSLNVLFPKEEAEIKKPVLRVENLSRAGEYHNISFEVKEGEIVGLAGLVGAGRTELARSIFGITKPENGKIYVYGQEVKIRNAKDAMDLGIGYLSESRGDFGLVLEMNITQNITLPILDKFKKLGLLDVNKELQISQKQYDAVQVRAQGLGQIVASLSGGNQQKVVIAKWLAAEPKVLILDEPTRGIDVGTKAAIHQLMSNLAKEGIAIIMISSELPEILGMSDRVIVMYEGIITKEYSRNDATQENILAAAIGEKKI